MSTGPGGLRLYRRLLGLLPADMRRRFGHDMEELLTHRLERAGSAGARGMVWARAVGDVLSHALRLRIDGARPGGPSELLQDARHASAALRSAPGVSLVCILTLGLGIGASTAVFSVADAVLRAEPPVHEPGRLVYVWPEANGNKAMALLAEERMPSLERVSGLSAWTLSLTGVGEPRELSALLVAPDYFELLGVDPILGRGFAEGEDLPGAAGVVVLSHGFWVDALGADPDVVGRVLDLEGGEYERRQVVGVMPAGVEKVWRNADVWVPLEGDPALSLRDDRSWYVNARIARLAPDATMEQAQAEVRSYAGLVQEQISGAFSKEDVELATVRSWRDLSTAEVRAPILLALGAVLIVLFIGCFNVTNLLLARSDRRHRDLAVRAALGAGRARIARLLLAESTGLGLLGGALGIGLAALLVRALRAVAPPEFPGLDAIALDAPVLGFAVACTLAATAVAGLIPAVRAGGVRALALLGGSTRGVGGTGGSRLTSALVGVQVALAVLVTLGSGLTLRSLGRLMDVDPGLDGAGVVTFTANPRASDYPDAEAYRGYFAAVSERVASLPGVESIGGIHLLPGTMDNWSFPTFPEGHAITDGGLIPSVNFRAVRDDYFGTVRLPVLRGRAVGNEDRADTEPVVVVNEAFVREFWPDVDPLGRSLSILSTSGTRYRVVGVAADVHQHGRTIEPLPEMYFSHGQAPFDQIGMWFMVRLRPGTDVSLLGPTIRESVWAVNPTVPVSEMILLDDALGRSTRGARFLTLLLTAFGAIALGLCAVGVFGVTAYVTGRRTGEFGVRVALGSSRARIVRASLLRALAPVAGGLLVGLVAAGFGSTALESVLYEIEPSDPITFLGTGLVLGLVGLGAAAVPAWRATGVDPARVLGAE